jgi:hypothetical protein
LKLLSGRAAGTLGEGDEDALLDEMDTVWWSMTDGDRQAVDQDAEHAREEARRQVAVSARRRHTALLPEIIQLQSESALAARKNGLSQGALRSYTTTRPLGPRP